MQTHTSSRRRNRVYKSLHKPLTYLGVERTLFYFVCVGAVGAFNLFNSLVAGTIFFALVIFSIRPNRFWAGGIILLAFQRLTRGGLGCGEVVD